MGSLHYMAPEQIRGLPTVDHRADIYAAGTVLYELLSGRKPFEGEDSFALMKAHVEEEPRAPLAPANGVSADLNATVLRALAKCPGDRFATAAEFRDALLELISHQGRIAGSTRRFRLSAIHHRPFVRLPIAGAVLAVVFLSFIAIWAVLVPPALSVQVRHAPPLPGFALKPPYLPETFRSTAKQRHPAKRLLGRLNPFRSGQSQSAR